MIIIQFGIVYARYTQTRLYIVRQQYDRSNDYYDADYSYYFLLDREKKKV